MKTIGSAALLSLYLLSPAHCEDSAPAAPLKDKSAAEWIKQLGADKFTEREEATKALIAAGQSIEADVRKAFENTGDNEVKHRTGLVLAALIPVDYEGDFVRISSESHDADGNLSPQVNENGFSTLSIEKGKVLFKQEYDGMHIDQTYTFPVGTRLKLNQKSELKLTWSNISDQKEYNPDSVDPKLTCVNTPQGRRVTLESTDTQGTSSKVIFAPKTEVERDPALKRKLKQEEN